MSNGRRMRLGSLAMSLMASLPRRGMLFHLVLAVKLVTAVEKFLVVAVANQFVEFRLRQEFVSEITRIKRNFFFKQETSCFAAGGSSGLLIEGNFIRHPHLLMDLSKMTGISL